MVLAILQGKALEKSFKDKPEIMKAFEIGQQNYLIVNYDGSNCVHNSK